MFEIQHFINITGEYFKLIGQKMFNLNIIIEILVISVVYFISCLIYSKVKTQFRQLLKRIDLFDQRRSNQLSQDLLFPSIFVFCLWMEVLLVKIVEIQFILSPIIGNLITAWVIIKIISLLLPDKFYVRIIAAIIWFITALRILNIYDETLRILDNIAFQSGNINISLLVLIKGLMLFIIFFWLAKHINRFLNKSIDNTEGFTPSVKAILSKLVKFSLFTVAFLITLSSIGVDLSAFAFLGGAVGVGVGFGLQKIVSNFISGIIILLDKSIKPGDVVEINNIYGRVKSLGTRFVSVVTLAGKEYLIPNENFITKQVINWSYSNELVRIEIPVGVGYNSDMELVHKLLLDSLKDKNRVVDNPAPDCLMIGFGESTVDFRLRFWINDPENGIGNIKSDVLFSIWSLFQQEGVNIAFPQQDLHLKSISPQMIEGLKQIMENEYDASQAAASTESNCDIGQEGD